MEQMVVIVVCLLVVMTGMIMIVQIYPAQISSIGQMAQDALNAIVIMQNGLQITAKQ